MPPIMSMSLCLNLLTLLLLLLVSDVTTDSYSLNTNSFIVVISTACGVLGLLLAVMSVVLLKRRFKPNGRLCPPAPGPTSHCGDYSTQHLNDQDREALIPHIDFAPSSIRPALLPTYEEAIMHPRSSSSQSSSPWASSSRHLRSFPALRATGAVTPFLRDQAMTDSSQHRNSITTMASGMTRADNGSIAFGSIDTVNASDGTSTSVTVDTCDSMASNPSIAMSHRAAAGSIDSASGNEVTSSGDIAAGNAIVICSFSNLMTVSFYFVTSFVSCELTIEIILNFILLCASLRESV